MLWHGQETTAVNIFQPPISREKPRILGRPMPGGTFLVAVGLPKPQKLREDSRKPSSDQQLTIGEDLDSSGQETVPQRRAPIAAPAFLVTPLLVRRTSE
jgi:hypothetical protein